MAAIFEPLRLRPERPAWTGSPTRIPSTIPPVEIPEEIRRRAANGTNGTAPEDDREGGAVLTPPGPGGDVYGGAVAPPSDGPLPPPPTSGT